MKIQTLNTGQRKKLLQLCEEFFPRYDCNYYNNFPETYYFINPTIKNITKKYNNRINIHWYQLCLTELPKRISSRIDRKDLEPGYSTGGRVYEIDYDFSDDNEGFIKMLILGNNKYKHPVDFLWNFVQECKKNKYFKNK